MIGKRVIGKPGNTIGNRSPVGFLRREKYYDYTNGLGDPSGSITEDWVLWQTNQNPDFRINEFGFPNEENGGEFWALNNVKIKIRAQGFISKPENLQSRTVALTLEAFMRQNDSADNLTGYLVQNLVVAEGADTGSLNFNYSAYLSDLVDFSLDTDDVQLFRLRAAVNGVYEAKILDIEWKVFYTSDF